MNNKILILKINGYYHALDEMNYKPIKIEGVIINPSIAGKKLYSKIHTISMIQSSDNRYIQDDYLCKCYQLIKKSGNWKYLKTIPLKQVIKTNERLRVSRQHHVKRNSKSSFFVNKFNSKKIKEVI